MPGKYYPFTVTGAGTDNTNPGEGDTRWVPVYWKTSENGTKFLHWVIGAANGISTEQTIVILIYLQEERYENGAWTPTGTEKYIKANVRTKPYSTSTITGFYNSVKGGDIRWTKAVGADGYDIYRKRAADGTKKIASLRDPDTLQYYDGDIKDNCWGRVYVYYVRPVYGTIAVPKSNEVTLQRLAPMVITSCRNSSAGAASLKWTCSVSSNKALGYEVQYATSKQDLFKRIGSFKKVSVNGRNSLSKTIKGLTKNKTYYFRIRCYVNYTHSVTHVTTKTWSQYSDVVQVKIAK